MPEPNIGRLFRGELGDHKVFFGTVVSIQLGFAEGEEALDAALTIRSVGIDFDIAE